MAAYVASAFRTRSNAKTDGSRGTVAVHATAAIFIAAALLVGVRATRGVDRPYDPDNYRDIAQAQTALDGHPFTDSAYRGEWIWYNPLLPWTLAAGGWATGAPLERLHVKAGPFLNILGPLALYLLTWRLSGGAGSALVALSLYLFVFSIEETPGYGSATYSPWLFATNFTHGIAFLTILGIVEAGRRRTIPAAALAGAGVGLTFLGHTAPAIIAAVIIAAVLPWRLLAVAALSGTLVASPYLVSILGHYRLHVLNPAPMGWAGWMALAPGVFTTTLWTHAPLVALAGLGLVLTRSVAGGVWLVTAFALTVYARNPVIAIVPAFHFWTYTQSALAVLGGAGIGRLARSNIPAIVVACVLAAWRAPTYADRADIRDGQAVASTRSADHSAAARFLRTLSTPDEVILGTHGAVNLIIGPAGRKTVAPHVEAANPYVAFDERGADREAMLEAIASDDAQSFSRLADRYGVVWVVLVGDPACTSGRQMLPFIRQFGDVCIFGATPFDAVERNLRDTQSAPAGVP